MADHRNPLPTVDVVILLAGDRVVLVERKNEPHGWALPGGFVDEGETLQIEIAPEVVVRLDRRAVAAVARDFDELGEAHAAAEPGEATEAR